MKIIFLFFFGCFFCCPVYASNDSLWKAYYQNVSNNSIVHSILNKYTDKSKLYERDSVFRLLKGNIPEKDNEGLNNLYRSYFSLQNFADKKFTIDQARYWAAFTESHKKNEPAFIAYRNLSKVLLYFKENERACEISDREYHFAHASNNKVYKIEALFDKARCYELKNNKTEAFKNYLDAYYFSLELNNKPFIERSLDAISDFFVSNKLYTKARKYKQQEFDLFLKNNPKCDSGRYFVLLSELSDNLFDNGQEAEANIYSDQVLRYCIRTGNRGLLLIQLSIIRSNFFENNNFDGLIDLYTVRFPSELDYLKQNNIIAYHRIRSLIQERKGEKALAILHLDSADRYLENTDYSPIMLSNFYTRKGEFFLRQDMTQEAIACLQKSYAITLPTKYYPFLKTITQNLDIAYARLGDYKLAHLYRGLSLAYTDSLRQMIDNDAIVLLEVDNVEKQKELLQIQQQALTDRKHNLQYMLIVILIATSFIVLIVLGSVKIPDIVIRGLGYFVFIFFFEFIILLADNKIHHMTHGEPLKILGLKIILIGMLLPLHHWVEEKVVHYLLHHHILQRFKIKNWVKTRIWRPKKKPVLVPSEAVVPAEAVVITEEEQT